MTSIAGGVLATVAVGLLLQPVVLRLMTAAAVLDRPNPRSSHTVPTPRGGGLAVVLAAAAGLLLVPQVRPLAAPLLLFAAIGLAEDLRGIPVPVRLVLQTAVGGLAGLLLVPGAPALGAAAGALAALFVVLVTAWLAAFVNAFNFMDGVNGISAVHAALAGLMYAGVGWWQQLPVLAAGGAVTAAAAVTFLPWNAGKARIFLGDVGSYGLGGLLGGLAAYGLLFGAPIEVALAPLGLYLADTGWTLARRCYRGEPWYRAHRSHAYQRLVRLGWSHQRVTLVTAMTSAAVCALGVVAAGGGLPSRLALDGLAAVVLAAYLTAPAALATVAAKGTRAQGAPAWTAERGVHV